MYFKSYKMKRSSSFVIEAEQLEPVKNEAALVCDVISRPGELLHGRNFK
jgi:hypothetical protein